MPPANDSGPAEAAERILVIRFSSLGDILLTALALRRLRARFPDAHIDFLVAAEFADAARLIPGPDRVLTFERSTGFGGLLALRRTLTRRYTILVDLQNSARSAYLRGTTFPLLWTKAKRYRFRRWVLIRFKKNLYPGVHPVPLRYLDALTMFGIDDDGRGLELQVPPALGDWAAEYLASRGLRERPLIALCPGARHATKRWPAERWMELGRRLTDAGYQPVIVGSFSERELLQEVAGGIAGSPVIHDRGVAEVAALFSHVAAVVSNDSALMHVAAGIATPVVAIFGPTAREFGFVPFRAPSEILDHTLYCRPCTAIGGPRCPETHFRCMLETESAAVAAACLRLVQAAGAPIP